MNGVAGKCASDGVGGLRRQAVVGIVIAVDGQPDLLEIVRTLGPGGGFTDFLNSRQQKADQDRNDSDDYQQFELA